MVIIANKKKIIGLITVLSLIFVLICINRLNLNLQAFKLMNNESDINNYTINVDMDDTNKKLKCRETISYINNSNKNLEKVYFHIYPNAFSKQEDAPFEKNELDEAYPNGFDEGYIHINKVLGKQYNLDYRIIGQKNDILEIDLGYNLKPKEKTNIYLEFDVKLPNSLGRFGYGEYTVNAANWYPIACVYDDRGWNKKSYEAIGDPFYSDVSNFKVIINVPSKYDIATTGKIKNKSIDKTSKTYEIKADKVRDFTFILSDKFNVLSANLGKTEIYSYFFNKDLGNKSLEAAKDSLKIFNNLFGEYPYDTYSVVASDFFIGGMEYPNLVMIDKTLYKDNLKFYLEYVIAHETAHQWWYSLVGNDEITNPWLDESLTEYSTILYFENKYGKEAKDMLIRDIKNKTLKKPIENVFKGTREFKNSTEYSLCVYSKGALLLDNIRNEVGDKVFFKTLKEYYKQNMYKNVTSEEFLSMWKKRGVNIEKIMDNNI